YRSPVFQELALEDWAWVSASLRLDVGRPDYLAPLLGVFDDELAEVGRRERKHRAAQVGKPRLHLGVGEARINFLASLSTIAAGVPFGAPMPCTELAS